MDNTTAGIVGKTERYLLIGWSLLTLVPWLLGNIMVLMGSIRYQAIKLDKVSVILIQNIAVGDLGYAVFRNLPILSNLIYNRCIYGNTLCKVTDFLDDIFGSASVVNLAALNMNKLTCILFPFKAAGKNSRTGYLIAAFSWTSVTLLWVAMLIEAESASIPISYNPHLFTCGYDIQGLYRPILLITILDALLFVLLPTLIITVCTGWMLLKIRRLQGVQRQGVIIAITVSIIFMIGCFPWVAQVIFWLPVLITGNQEDSSTNGQESTAAGESGETGDPQLYSRVATFMAFIYFASNPIIYCVTIRSFKRFVKSLFWNVLGRGELPPSETSNSNRVNSSGLPGVKETTS